MPGTCARPPRLAILAIPGLDHFLPDLVRGLGAAGQSVRVFAVRSRGDLDQALAWADAPDIDALWFEFCWPPFPALLAQTDLGGRRVLMRIHRVEAYGAEHAAAVPWHRVHDAILVCEHMAGRLRALVPEVEAATRLRVVHNGVDAARFGAAGAAGGAPRDPFRIGWCGWLSLHKNPNLALEVLHRLRQRDARWQLHVATQGGDVVAADSFGHLAHRMGVAQAIHVTEGIPPAAMPDWHARNAVLLSTSVYESFGYAIAEAAASGCDVAMLDHAAAAEFWPEAMRFATVDGAVERILGAAPDRWRGLIAERFSLTRQVTRVLDILHAPQRPIARPAETVVPIAHGPWHGRFLLRSRADHIQHAIATSGRFYEAAMLEDLRGRLSPGELCVDVGANVGNHALFAAGVCGARVVAVEPSPALADHCAANLALNGLSERLVLRRHGLGAVPGRAGLLPGPAANAGMTRLGPTGDGEAVEVMRLDDLLTSLGVRPSVIKIDVEGMELDVLRGAVDSLRRHRPTLYVETATAGEFLDIRDCLAPLGYAPAACFNATPTWLFLPDP